MKLVLEIPGLPPMQNTSGSTKTHWAQKAREVKRWHMEVFLAVRKAGWHAGMKPMVKANVTITRFSSLRPDFDGLVSGGKALLDGLVRAKVLANDRQENIGQPQYHWESTVPRAGRVRIEVEPL